MIRHQQARHIPWPKAKSLSRRLDSWPVAPLWVDARSRAAFQAHHIPGAVWLNEDEGEASLPQLLAVWQPGIAIVVYCDSRQCDASTAVATRLREELQLTDIYVLKGSFLGGYG